MDMDRICLSRLQYQLESNPDNWFRRLAQKLWDENVDAAAEFLGSDPNNLVLITNATAGEELPAKLQVFYFISTSLTLSLVRTKFSHLFFGVK